MAGERQPAAAGGAPLRWRRQWWRPGSAVAAKPGSRGAAKPLVLLVLCRRQAG